MPRKILINDIKSLTRDSQVSKRINSLIGKNISELKNIELLELVTCLACILTISDETGRIIQPK